MPGRARLYIQCCFYCFSYSRALRREVSYPPFSLQVKQQNFRNRVQFYVFVLSFLWSVQLWVLFLCLFLTCFLLWIHWMFSVVLVWTCALLPRPIAAGGGETCWDARTVVSCSDNTKMVLNITEIKRLASFAPLTLWWFHDFTFTPAIKWRNDH